MRVSIRRNYLVFVLLAFFILSDARAEDVRASFDVGHVSKIRNIVVTSGTLEWAADTKIGYTFEFQGGQDFFCVGSSLTSSGILSARVVGFKLSNGRKYFYGDEGTGELEKRAAKENPGEIAAFRLYKGEDESVFELKTKGKTPVYRVEMVVDGQKITIWTNREEQQK